MYKAAAALAAALFCLASTASAQTTAPLTSKGE